jgi:predicted metalloprotease with PDZ domain
VKVLLLLSFFAPQAVEPVFAQQTQRDCRCVDASGNEIPNCTCFRAPNVGNLRIFSNPRARIGVSLEEAVEGARVSEVMQDSPASAAGLLAGDVIVRVGAQNLRQPLTDQNRERSIDDAGDVAVQRLMAVAQDWEPGAAVELEILRAGERRTIRVTPEENTAQTMVFGGPNGRLRVFGDGRGLQADSLMRTFRFDMDSLRADGRFFGLRADSLGRAATMFRFSNGCGGARGLTVFGMNCVDGVSLVELNPDLGAYFGVTSGVLVSEVADGSALGLRAGDVILSIGGRTVATPEQAQRIIASYGDDENVPMRVRRRNEEIDVTGQRR